MVVVTVKSWMFAKEMLVVADFDSDFDCRCRCMSIVHIFSGKNITYNKVGLFRPPNRLLACGC